mmetsp:Transcript_20220/g.45840  ORF Transcript_20220/g.45840 Transcript_20220/m.45840 type:complete len:229 (+) Transcript_20220:1898-2584(+)
MASHQRVQRIDGGKKRADPFVIVVQGGEDGDEVRPSPRRLENESNPIDENVLHRVVRRRSWWVWLLLLLHLLCLLCRRLLSGQEGLTFRFRGGSSFFFFLFLATETFFFFGSDTFGFDTFRFGRSSLLRFLIFFRLHIRVDVGGEIYTKGRRERNSVGPPRIARDHHRTRYGRIVGQISSGPGSQFARFFSLPLVPARQRVPIRPRSSANDPPRLFHSCSRRKPQLFA